MHYAYFCNAQRQYHKNNSSKVSMYSEGSDFTVDISLRLKKGESS